MPISRLVSSFKNKNDAGQGAFIAFITAGYDSSALTVDALLTLEKGGADIIEVGIPFSDPTADGPAIQAASVVALNKENHTTPYDCIQMVKAAREKGLKAGVVLMTYTNPLLHYGYEKLCKECSEAGVDGFIVVDLPPDDGEEFLELCTKYDLSFVPLIAPNSTLERIKLAAKAASSWMYLVSTKGVTGQRDDDAWTQMIKELEGVIATVRSVTDIPIGIGFGISTSEHVRLVLSLGLEGYVVGSAIINAISSAEGGASTKEGLENRCKAIEKLCSNLTTQNKRPDPLPTLTMSPEAAAVTSVPSNKWKFEGGFGGRYIPETLMPVHDEVAVAFEAAMADPEFTKSLAYYRKHFIGGPTPMYHAKRLSEHLGGAQIWFKREELAHTGAHKINNAVGQCLLAMRLGKKRIVAETGAGQHGVATATVCAHFGLECIVYMGEVDCERQKLNVFRMNMLGAKVVPVTSGSRTLKDAVNEAIRDWVGSCDTTHYLIGSAIGAHPFPLIVKTFQSIIGKEARQQMLEQAGCLPDYVIACIGGGSNAIGIFSGFVDDKTVELVGVEAGGEDADGPKHAATISRGTPGVFHGIRTYLLQTQDGGIKETHSISAGLDYPGVGPEHASLKSTGRAKYYPATDKEALDALQVCAQKEGIIPALEPAHALAYAMKLAKTLPKEKTILVNVCGRGDKDMPQVAKVLGYDV